MQTSKQHLFYAIGILAYAVAKSDDKIQPEELKTLKEIVKSEIDHEVDFGYTEIVFQLLAKDGNSIETVYKWAMNSMELGKHHLTMDLKYKFCSILKKVAAAFPPSTEEEKELIKRFDSDIEKVIVKHPIE